MWRWWWQKSQSPYLSVEAIADLSPALLYLPEYGGLQWRGERSLLEVLDRADVPVRSSCRSGNCGACLAYLQSGKVGYTKETTFPLEAGELLMCACVPLSDIHLQLPDKPVGARRNKS